MFKSFQQLSIYLFLLFLMSCYPDSDKTLVDQGQEDARIKTSKGDILLEFNSKVAPATVSRIKKLIKDGFYNGLHFHRVVKDFIIQTGDPSESGNGGSGLKLKPEISKLSHIRGTVSMARSSDINSADSQFFITLGDYPHLDGKYTIFAKVKNGMDVADKIVEGDKILSVSLETNSLKSK